MLRFCCCILINSVLSVFDSPKCVYQNRSGLPVANWIFRKFGMNFKLQFKTWTNFSSTSDAFYWTVSREQFSVKRINETWKRWQTLLDQLLIRRIEWINAFCLAHVQCLFPFIILFDWPVQWIWSSAINYWKSPNRSNRISSGSFSFSS